MRYPDYELESCDEREVEIETAIKAVSNSCVLTCVIVWFCTNSRIVGSKSRIRHREASQPVSRHSQFSASGDQNISVTVSFHGCFPSARLLRFLSISRSSSTTSYRFFNNGHRRFSLSLLAFIPSELFDMFPPIKKAPQTPMLCFDPCRPKSTRPDPGPVRRKKRSNQSKSPLLLVQNCKFFCCSSAEFLVFTCVLRP
jgi:hypothetical protein